MAEIKSDPQCIFCKIVKGEIPSKKILETSHCLAVLDIYPASKGHAIILPKTHAVILPQVPAEVLADMAILVKKISDLAFKSFKPAGLNVFLANGQIAGQKMPHVLVHVIPRYENDGIPMKLPENQPNTEELETVYNTLLQKTNVNLNMKFTPLGAGKTIQPSQISATTTAPASIPNQAPQAAPSSPPTIQSSSIAGSPSSSQIAQTPPQPQISEEQLHLIIENNPKLKSMLLENPAGLKEAISKTPQLQMVFAGVDIDALSKKMKGGADLDKISALFDKK